MGLTNTYMIHKSLINKRIDDVIELKFNNMIIHIPSSLYRGYTINNGILIINGCNSDDFVQSNKNILRYEHNTIISENASSNDEYI